MAGQITKEEKHKRCKELISVFDSLEESYYKKHIGCTLTIIAETYEDGFLTGHSDNYLKVRFNGSEDLLGKEIKVKINKYENKMLFGSMI